MAVQLMRAPVGDAELYYEIHGRGLPMLLMHGGLGLDHTSLRPWLDPLGEHAELVFYDHRGNGRSSRPTSYAGIGHSTWVDDADALRKHLGHERIVLFGHSYGGHIAQEYALRYPDALAGLILCSGTPALDYPDVIMANAAARGTPEQLAALERGLAANVRDDDDFRALWNTLLPLYFHGFDREIAAAMDAATQYSAAAFNHAFGHCIASFNTAEALGRLRVPTLILVGRHDWITPPTQAERLHARIAGSEVVVFENSGHFPFIEERGHFVATVTDWLASLR